MGSYIRERKKSKEHTQSEDALGPGIPALLQAQGKLSGNEDPRSNTLP